jgi:hypothetical protein
MLLVLSTCVYLPAKLVACFRLGMLRTPKPDPIVLPFMRDDNDQQDGEFSMH